MAFQRTEYFDRDVLELLLRHEGVSEQDKLNLKKYKKKRQNGNEVLMKYDYSDGAEQLKKGRIYPSPFLGLATFPREIRHALTAKYYDEVDMENSQPTLLIQVAKELNCECSALEEYVVKRKEVLEAIQKTQKISYDEAKELCIAVLFGGKRDEHPLLPKIKAELDILSAVVFQRFPEFVEFVKAKRADRIKRKKRVRNNNIVASVLANYIQDLETRIFLAITTFFHEKEWSVDIHQHDGGSVRRKESGSIPQELFREAEKLVLERFGYRVVLAIKPVVCGFDLTSVNNTAIVPPNILINDSFAAKKFVDLVGDSLRRVGSELYIRDNKGIWNTGEEHLRILIHQHEAQLVWKQYNSMGMLVPHDYGGNTVKIAKMITQLQVWAKEGELPLQFSYTLAPSCSPQAKEQILATFLQLISLVCNHKEPLKRYVLHWLAHLLQFPYVLAKVMLILSGSKGVGKDTLFDFLIEFVFGSFTAHNYTSNKQFFDKYDTDRKGKLLVKLEEADRKACLENGSDLKAWITGSTATFNGKLQKAVTVPNYTRFVFTTNKGNPVDFTADERRFVILPCSSEKKGDKDFWTMVRTTLFNPEAGKAVAEYLMSLDLSDFNIFYLPQNEYQEQVIETEEKPEQKFLESWGGQEWTTMKDLYDAYCEYCQENNLYYVDNTVAFGKLLLPFVRDGIVLKDRRSAGMCYRKAG